MNCDEATALVSQGLDRDLAIDERVTLHMHLLICTGCSRYREQMGFLRMAARRMARGELPPEADQPAGKQAPGGEAGDPP